MGDSSEWTETGLNGNNKPSEVGSALAAITGTHGLGQMNVWDLDVSQISAGDFITLIVKHSDGNDVAFASDETTQAPELVITAGGEPGNALALRSLNSLILSPNPASDLVTISFTGQIQVRLIQVFELTGRLIMNIPAEEIDPKRDYQMNVEGFPEGIFFVKAIDDNGIPYQNQLVIQR
jgi:hypothetical protein